MNARRPVRVLLATSLLALSVPWLSHAAAQVTGVDLTGQWNWTNVSEQTGSFFGIATIQHDVGAGTFTWTWTGNTTSSIWEGTGTVSGSSFTMSGHEGDTYTAEQQGTILDEDHLEGTWTQSDGQYGTSSATRIETEPTEGRVASSTFPFTHRIDKAKKELKSQLDQLIATHEQVEEELVLKQRALDNQIELHRFRLSNVETIEGQLSELRIAIADGIGSEDSEEMNRLRRFLKDAKLEEFAQRLVMKNKEREVQNLLVKRDGVRRQLLQLVEPMEALDFELVGMVVKADSVPVYAVDVTSPFERLAQLNREIKELRETLIEIAVEKKEAIDSFTSVHQAGSRQLAAIADLIWRNAKIKASVDLATNTVDILIAGTKGGLAGAAVEAASKLYQGFLEYQTAGPIGDPNPGKDAVDAWFNESVVDTVGQSALALGIERGIKETAGKLAKDYLTEEIGQLIPQLQGGTPPDGTPPGVTSHQVRRSRGFLARLKDLAPKLKNERLFKAGFKEWAKGSVGRKLVVDAGKALLARRLEGEEMEAWREYIRLDTQAQGLFSLWQAAANAFWETSDQIEARELEKSQILLEFDPSTGQTIKLQDTFPIPLTLEVRLIVPRSTKPFENVPIRVFVSGVQASRIGPKQFHVAFDKLPASDVDALAVEVR